MKQDCVFCSIVAGEMPASIVHRDDHTMAFLDIRPINEGHTLVIPLEHASRLADLPADTAGYMMGIAQTVAAGLYKSKLKPSGVNLVLADGASAGQEVFHAHLHVIPRYQGDGFGFRLPTDRSDHPNRQELDATAASLREQITDN